MKTHDFYFDLPPELIAQTPIAQRDASRLLVLDKTTGATEHRHFFDLPEYLHPGDCLILNNSRVLPARLLGHRVPGGGACEILLLIDRGDNVWECLVRPGKKLRKGAKVSFGDGELTALQFLQALRRSGKRASELASCCPQYPQELINVAVSHVPGVKDAIMQDPTLRHAIAQMEQELAGKGRVLIRPSGTEALIRVMVEAKTTEVARKVAEDLADLIKILSEKIQF